MYLHCAKHLDILVGTRYISTHHHWNINIRSGKCMISGTWIHWNREVDVYEFGKPGAYKKAGICTRVWRYVRIFGGKNKSTWGGREVRIDVPRGEYTHTWINNMKNADAREVGAYGQDYVYINMHIRVYWNWKRWLWIWKRRQNKQRAKHR